MSSSDLNGGRGGSPASEGNALSNEPGRELSPEAKATGLFGPLIRMLSRERSEAPADFNRWMAVPPSFLVQLSIGSVYAWSCWNEPLIRELGVVASAADDWGLGSVVPIFSSCAVSLGLCTFFLGKWAERVGPRMVSTAAAAAWVSGLSLTGVGVMTHTLPLLYLGYGVLGGAGWGLGYISPVSTLLKWFPDRRGLASGMALTAFGGGALLATPINEALLRRYFEAPQYLGAEEAVEMVTRHGRRFAEVAGKSVEVVTATANELSRLPGDLAEGVYVVGTGNTGAAAAFFTLAAGYAAAMTLGASLVRVPPPNWHPEGFVEPLHHDEEGEARERLSVHPDQVVKTPQFYLLWAAVAGNAIAGVSVISCGKTLMSEAFGTVMPAVVTGGVAASFVAALSAANMFGRLGWATASDHIGRRNAYFGFAAGIPLCLAIPSLTGMAMDSPSMPLLLAFSGSTLLIVSFYGGVFSVLPAYIAELFGPKHVGAIHGRALTAWSGAALGGPTILAWLRESSYHKAVEDLAARADPAAFERHFGVPVSDLPELIEAKTASIQSVLEILPAGTADPTPTVYNTTMYAMAGVLAAAAACNAALSPVKVTPAMTLAAGEAIENAAPAAPASPAAPAAGGAPPAQAKAAARAMSTVAAEVAQGLGGAAEPPARGRVLEADFFDSRGESKH